MLRNGLRKVEIIKFDFLGLSLPASKVSAKKKDL